MPTDLNERRKPVDFATRDEEPDGDDGKNPAALALGKHKPSHYRWPGCGV
jgi:hypothetical protein